MQPRLVACLASLCVSLPALSALGDEAELFREVPLVNEAGLARDSIDLASVLVDKNKKDGVQRRAFHAKAHACVRADLTLYPNRPAQTRYGLFARDTTYRTWMRFSSAASGVATDLVPDARGLALKVVGVAGQKLVEPSSQTHDFLFFSSPALFAKDAYEYVAILKAVMGRASKLALIAHYPH